MCSILCSRLNHKSLPVVFQGGAEIALTKKKTMLYQQLCLKVLYSILGSVYSPLLYMQLHRCNFEHTSSC